MLVMLPKVRDMFSSTAAMPRRSVIAAPRVALLLEDENSPKPVSISVSATMIMLTGAALFHCMGKLQVETQQEGDGVVGRYRSTEGPVFPQYANLDQRLRGVGWRRMRISSATSLASQTNPSGAGNLEMPKQKALIQTAKIKLPSQSILETVLDFGEGMIKSATEIMLTAHDRVTGSQSGVLKLSKTPLSH